MLLKDKLAVITGGASGQGLASARLFLREGARVVILDWNQDTGTRAAEELQALGQARFIHCDLGQEDQVTAACDSILTQDGVPDILFNNAGIGYSESGRYPMTSIFDTTLETWNNILRINLTGAFLMTRSLGRAMAQSGKGGSVIFNASIAGIIGQANIDAYTASKGALVALTRALANSLGGQGIRVNAIAPGAVDTPMLAPALKLTGVAERLAATPLNRIGQPEDIAGLALYLASDLSSFVTGQIIACDGGRSCI